MIRYLTCLLLLMAAPVQADPSWAQFFNAPGAEIDRSAEGGREAVQLPGDVLVMRQRGADGWSYVGLDRSAQGAVGCVALLLIEVNRAAAQCESFLRADQTQQLRENLTRLSDFYASNAVPATTADAFLAEVAAHAAQSPPLQCVEITDGFSQMAGQLTDATSKSLMDDLLSVPRLPVKNPCL